MLDDIAGTYGSHLFVAVGGVGLALVVLFLVLWVIRNRAPSPFVRGGRNRQPRLQVLDAAAIDARRRIVLIRRDGVEHLVMIGGPTDIVIESGIGDLSKTPSAAPQPIATSPTLPESLPAAEPLEALGPREPVRPRQQIEAPREPPRVSNRHPEPTKDLSAPPVQATIAAPERRAEPAAMAPPPIVEPVSVPPPVVVAPAPPPVVVAPPAAMAQPIEQPQPPAPLQRVEPTIVFERKEEAEAADVLDAARERVLAPQPERVADLLAETPPPAPPVAPAPILVQDAYNETSDEAMTPDVLPPRKLGSDFDSVLEVEMSRSLTAERTAPAAPPVAPRPMQEPAPPVPQQRRDPEMAPITGGDAALQKEVARIFGEMSVNREK